MTPYTDLLDVYEHVYHSYVATEVFHNMNLIVTKYLTYHPGAHE